MVKVRLNKISKKIDIKEEDKVLLSTKNLINNKLDILYIETFRGKDVKNITTLLKLSNIRIYLRVYISLLKKTSLSIVIITI